jgi:hypothetical protein
MEPEWTTDELGIRRWSADGWSITDYRGGQFPGAFYVHNDAHPDWDVDIVDGNLWVKGEGPGGWEGPSPDTVVIPARVLRAILSLMENP